MMMGGVVQLVIFLGWGLALLLGCVMAVRGRRGWATITMLSGVILQIVGIVGVVAGLFLARSVTTTTSGGGIMTRHGPPEVLMFIVALMIALGFLLFAVGFIGFCARYGAAERRAAELEVLVQVLQERMEEESR